MAENDLADALSDRALDAVDTVVATVNDKAIRPAIVAARGIVFGVVIAVIGITVVVLSNRYQCADPMFFEAFGLDIGKARVVVVKSRGHFRGGFDEFYRDTRQRVLQYLYAASGGDKRRINDFYNASSYDGIVNAVLT